MNLTALVLYGILDNMNAITYSQARENLAKTISRVCEDHSPVIITKKGTEAVVMISLEDYEAMEETAFLLRSPKNARRLSESIEQLERGKGKERKLFEE
jgi:antitoxin YefM